jgi:hypothetical protein
VGIRIPDPEARMLRNFSGKMHFLVIKKQNKNLPLKGIKLHYFLRKNFFDLI